MWNTESHLRKRLSQTVSKLLRKVPGMEAARQLGVAMRSLLVIPRDDDYSPSGTALNQLSYDNAVRSFGEGLSLEHAEKAGEERASLLTIREAYRHGIEWPRGSRIERRAIFIYEAARLQAYAVNAPIVPEPWSQREQAFRDQFLKVVAMMCSPRRKKNPAELHADWMKAYETMGWKYGEKRDTGKKEHPDMLPFDELPWREQNKDAVFVALCEIARRWIIHEDDASLFPPGN